MPTAPLTTARLVRPLVVAFVSIATCCLTQPPDDSGKTAVQWLVAIEEQAAAEEDSQYVRLSDYRGKKAVLMVFMNATDPWAWHGKIALDDMAQHFRDQWMDQGGGAYIVLVDSAGTIAYADYHRDIPPHWGPKAVNFPYEFLTIRMNHLESRLEGFFAADGRYDKKIETDYPTWRLPKERDRASLAKSIRYAVWMPAIVTAVDTAGRRVTVERTLPPRTRMKGIRFWDDAGNRASAFDPVVRARLDTVRAWLADSHERPTYELHVEDSTDVFVNGWSKPINELRVGDRIGVCYAAGRDESYMIRPLQIRCYRHRCGPK